MSRILDTLSVAIVLYAAIPANLFPIFYSRRPWKKSFIGRALMVYGVGIAALIDVTVAFYVFGDYAGRDLIRVAVFGTVAVGITLEFMSLLRADPDRDLSDEHEGENAS